MEDFLLSDAAEVLIIKMFLVGLIASARFMQGVRQPHGCILHAIQTQRCMCHGPHVMCVTELLVSRAIGLLVSRVRRSYTWSQGHV